MFLRIHNFSGLLIFFAESNIEIDKVRGAKNSIFVVINITV